jgi:ABC-type multidrug transport system fused ATPase/permease subunit
MNNTKKVLSFIWIELKKYKVYLIFGFLLWGLVSVIGVAFIPMYIKKLTNILELGNYNQAFNTMWVLIGIIVLERLAYFFTLHILSYLQSHTSKNLDSFSFGFFAKHSYDFYTNEFTGSLVDKMKRLGLNVVSIIDVIVFDFFGMLISTIAIVVVLFNENYTIGISFILFIFFYLSLVSWVAQKMSPLF